MRRRLFACAALLLTSFAGTAHADRPTRHVEEAMGVWRMEGLSSTSWYGPGFAGKPMANGRRFDRYGRSAAHRTLPLGTTVRLRNPANGRSEVVTIEDRGPFIRGRVFDVSEGTATRLGFREQGLAMLEAEIIR
jgi:rare lipoprotein A